MPTIWRLAETYEPWDTVAEFTSYERAVVYLHRVEEGERSFRFDTFETQCGCTLEWRIWAIDARGIPSAELAGFVTRTAGEAYARLFRPAAAEWGLFRLQSNGDLDRYGLNAGPAVPAQTVHAPSVEWDGEGADPRRAVPSDTTYHAIRRGYRAGTTSEFEIMRSFDTEAEAHQYVAFRRDDGLSVVAMSGIDLGLTPVQPVAPEPVPEAVPQLPKPRTRAIRIA